MNKTQYVYNQISQEILFTKETSQVRQEVDLGEDFRQTKQYSIWGWFRYIDGDQLSIMNILNLYNYKKIDRTSANIQPFPNPNYPDCPYTSEQIKKIPNIKNQTEVQDNPNCFPQKIDKTEVYGGNINAKTQDVLYVNFDLVQIENENPTFNLTFLFQNGPKPNFIDMKIEGFNDIPLLGQFWTFFAISFDYQSGQTTMYFKIFDNSINNSKIKTLKLDYPEFQLDQKSTLTIASVENNNYFESVAGFTGDIAYIEMSSFYTNQLNTIWTGYMNSISYPYKGIIIDIQFDIIQQNQKLKSTGFLNEEYTIDGNYKSLFQIDPNKLGIRFFNTSKINFDIIDTSNLDNIKAIMFYMKLSYHEDLPTDFTIIQRGTKLSNGYIRISLLKVDNGRVIQLQLQGNRSLQENQFISTSTIPQDRQIIFQVGLVTSPSGSGRYIYVDQYGTSTNELINDNLDFNMTPQNITLFDNQNQNNYKGYIDVKSFKILNTASSAEFYNQTLKAFEKNKFDFRDDCLFKSSYYKNASICLDCKTKVLSTNNICVNYCQKTFKNPLEGTCKQCQDNQNCNEIQKTTWTVEKVKSNIFRLRPTRKLLGGFDDIKQNLELKFENENQINEKYDYRIIDSYVNQDDQYIDIEIQFRESIVDKQLQFKINEDEQNTQYDINRNQIFHQDKYIVKGINLNTVKEGICYVKTIKRRALKALAITALVMFFLSVFVLILVTLFCSSRIFRLGALWKFLLHNWMKIQLIAFLLFLAIYMPCCVKEFLRWLYLIAVSWNHALGKHIDNINQDNSSFQRGMNEARPPKIFYNERIEVFYLHNFGIFFIIQGFFFLLYIVLKIWDILATQSANLFYKLFVFMEFSGLIALFMITAMQTFVFSALNWRYAVFYHSYFVMCFLITIAYIAFFIIFWFYSLIKLISTEYAFMNPIVRDRYFYFFSGYKNQKWSRTWDHWMLFSHFLIGLMIGLLVYHQLSQMIIITSVLVILLCITLILRPWVYTIFTIVEIIQQLLILAAVILFLMIAIYDHSNCLTCGKRESVTCWFIVILLFFAIIFGALGLIAQTLISLASNEEDKEEVQYRSTAKQSQTYMQDNYVQQDIYGKNNVKNIYNEEVNMITQNQQFDEDVSKNKMQDFMNKIQVDDDQSYITNNQSYSYVDVPMQGRAPHELAPDSEDEKYNIDGVVRALNADDSLDSDDLEDSRLELDQQRNHLKVNEQRFYDSVYKPSYENSFVTERNDQQKLNNLISNRNIQEETVIRNKKINRTSFNSDINTY